MAKTYVHIMANGTVERFEADEANELAQLQEKVGGYIEGVACPSGMVLFVDEEGAIKPDPVYNERASDLARCLLVGDAVLTGGYNAEGETKGVRTGVLKQLGL